jgi:hypothetical protein
LTVTWTLEPDDLKALESGLGSACDRLTADETFEAHPTQLCRWCKYRGVCPEGSGQADPSQLGAEPATSF